MKAQLIPAIISSSDLLTDVGTDDVPTVIGVAFPDRNDLTLFYHIHSGDFYIFTGLTVEDSYAWDPHKITDIEIPDSLVEIVLDLTPERRDWFAVLWQGFLFGRGYIEKIS